MENYINENTPMVEYPNAELVCAPLPGYMYYYNRRPYAPDKEVYVFEEDMLEYWDHVHYADEDNDEPILDDGYAEVVVDGTAYAVRENAILRKVWRDQHFDFDYAYSDGNGISRLRHLDDDDIDFLDEDGNLYIYD